MKHITVQRPKTIELTTDWLKAFQEENNFKSIGLFDLDCSVVIVTDTGVEIWAPVIKMTIDISGMSAKLVIDGEDINTILTEGSVTLELDGASLVYS